MILATLFIEDDGTVYSCHFYLKLVMYHSAILTPGRESMLQLTCISYFHPDTASSVNILVKEIVSPSLKKR
jgi:hypothetical protein